MYRKSKHNSKFTNLSYYQSMVVKKIGDTHKKK